MKSKDYAAWKLIMCPEVDQKRKKKLLGRSGKNDKMLGPVPVKSRKKVGPFNLDMDPIGNV